MHPLLALSTDTLLRIIAIAVPIGAMLVIAGVAWLAVKLHRRSASAAPFEKLMERAVARAAIHDRDVRESDHDPLVTITFHTYSGFLHHFTQIKHSDTYPSSIARAYLDELHNYNLIHCLIPYAGSFYVPILTWIEYRAQLKSIERQVTGAVSQAPKSH